MNIDFLEMRGRGFEHLDVSKPHWNIIRERDPETAETLRPVQVLLAGRLDENRLWRVA